MKKTFRLMTMTAMAAALWSCNNEKDLFNPNYKSQAYAEDWIQNFGEVNPNQTWSSYAPLVLDVAVNETPGETYSVSVLSASPYKLGSKAQMLAAGEVQTGKGLQLTTYIPGHLSNVFVTRTAKDGSVLGMFVPIHDGKAEAVFGQTAVRAYSGSTPSVTIDTHTLASVGYSADEIQTMLDGAMELETSYDAHSFQTTDNMCWKVTSDKDYNQNLLPSDNGTYKNGGEVPVIIANGATLTLQNEMVPQKVCFIVTEGATLFINGTVNMPNEARIINAGGTITGSSSARFTITNASNGSINYSSGKIELNYLNVNGGTLYNCGTIEVNEYANTSKFGTTTALINQGEMHVKGNASLVNSNVSNGCKLYIDGGIDEVSVLTLGDNSYMKVGGVYQTANRYATGGSQLVMGKASLLSAAEFRNNGVTVIAPATVDNAADYDEYAHIYFGNVTQWNSAGPIKGYYAIDATADRCLYGDGGSVYDYPINWQYTNYSYFTYDCFGETWEYQYDRCNPVEGQHAVVGAFDVTEPKAEDCGAFVGFGPVDIDDSQTATYVYEDLGGIGDYDFNDVVVRAAYKPATGKVTLTLAAAGGMLETNVRYNGTSLGEVHELFGVSTSTMVNTGRGESKPEVNLGTFDVPADADITSLPIDIAVKDKGAVVIVTRPTKGEAPQSLIIPGDWQWPTEMQAIDKAYPKFGTFASGDTPSDWYLK